MSARIHFKAADLPLHYMHDETDFMIIQTTTVASCPDCADGVRRWDGQHFVCSASCGADELAPEDILLEWDEQAVVNDRGTLIIAWYVHDDDE